MSSLASFPPAPRPLQRPCRVQPAAGYSFSVPKLRARRSQANTNLKLIQHTPLKIPSDRSVYSFCIRLQVSLETGLTFLFLIQFFWVQTFIACSQNSQKISHEFVCPSLHTCTTSSTEKNWSWQGCPSITILERRIRKAKPFDWPIWVESFCSIQAIKISRYLISVLTGKRLKS